MTTRACPEVKTNHGDTEDTEEEMEGRSRRSHSRINEMAAAFDLVLRNEGLSAPKGQSHVSPGQSAAALTRVKMLPCTSGFWGISLSHSSRVKR